MLPEDLAKVRNDFAGAELVEPNGQSFRPKKAVELQSVSIFEGSTKQGFRDFEPDEIMISLRQIAGARDLYHIEGELRHDVGRGIVLIGDTVPIFSSKSRIHLRN